MEASISVTHPDRTAVASVRAFIRETLSGWECSSVLDDAELIVSELATNAVIHGASPVTVTARFSDGVLRIEVDDRDPSEPVMTAALLEGTLSGRGLSIVAAVARSWGFEPRANGKVVWAELDPTAPTDTPGVEDLGDVQTMADALDQIPPGTDPPAASEGSALPNQ